MVTKPTSSKFTMPHPSKMASDSAEHDSQKELSSPGRSDDNHNSQKQGAASASSKSVLSLDDQSNDTQDTDPHSRRKGSEDLNSASNESSFQPCLICKLDNFVLSSLGKFTKAGVATPCSNEHTRSQEGQEEEDYEVVDPKEAMEGDQDDQDDHMVIIEDLDDEYLQY